MSDRILDLEALAKVISEARAAGRRVVLCHGCFDPLHVGHIRHFQEARAGGDVLAVTVTPDRYVNKGSERPIFSDDLRAEAVAAIAAVDYVAVNRWPTAQETLRLLVPHVYAKGNEFDRDGADPTGKLDLERAVVEEIGAEMLFTDTMVYSSTRLVHQWLKTGTDSG